jgi:predicted esterase
VLITAVVLILIVGFGLYTSQYYRADADAIEVLQRGSDRVTITSTDYGWFFDGPSEDSALIFYPGAKVEETAYAPLLHRIAEGQMDVCLVKMPFHLAVFDRNAAEKVIPQYDYEKWYIGGHSLGGAMAALHASDRGDFYKGIFLFASYPSKPLPENMKEILLVGSEDGVIRWEKVQKAREYSSKDYTEHIIEGGNHAQFGSYGRQKGDGRALISARMQINESVEVIKDALSY